MVKPLRAASILVAILGSYLSAVAWLANAGAGLACLEVALLSLLPLTIDRAFPRT